MQPGCQCQDSSGAQEVIENKTFHKWLAKLGAQNWRREYSALDRCPPADTWFFEMESTSQEGQTNADPPSLHRCRLSAIQPSSCRWGVTCSRQRSRRIGI